MKYTYNSVEKIIKQIDLDDSRWDSILELKALNDSKYLNDFIVASHHMNWIVRWVVVEKLAEFKHPNSMKRLVELIDDSDPHVRKNVVKSIKYYGPDIVPILIHKFLHNHFRVRLIVRQILLFFGNDVVDKIVSNINGKNWIIDNQLFYVLLDIDPDNLDEIMISLLPYNSVQKNCLVILSDSLPTQSISPVVRLYSQYSFRTFIFNYLSLFPKPVLFNKLIQMYLSDKKYFHLYALLLIRFGKSTLPYLFRYLTKYTSYIPKLLVLIEKVGPEEIISKIHEYAKTDYNFAQKTRLIRQRYPKIN